MRIRALVIGGLCLVALVSIMALSRRDPRPAVLVVGDSIVGGKYQHPTLMARLPAYRFTSRAVGGCCSPHVVGQLRGDRAGYAAVVIGVGTNDAYRHLPLATYRANLRELVRLAGPGRAVLVAPPLVLPGSPGLTEAQVRPYRAVMEAVATEAGCRYVPPVIPARRALYWDTTHPNGRGAAYLARAIGEELEAICASSTRSRELPSG